ncbi:protein SDA1-like protein [Trichinella spiralis]|uniref:protein SDA1-like protein n=1 Tax=Trichinella spiralis TaxID=6334 RepID=UPI0001EFCBAD|nr:protein SDA1-like protein [Trichinella spiralis]
MRHPPVSCFSIHSDSPHHVFRISQHHQARKAPSETDRDACSYSKQKLQGTHVGRNKKQLAKLNAFPMVKHKSSLKTKNRSFMQQHEALNVFSKWAYMQI